MMKMHHVIAVRDFSEIKRLMLAAQRDQPFLLPQRPHGLVASENFRIAQHHQLARWPDKSAQERPHDKGNRIGINPRIDENFLEPLLLAFVVAEDCHLPALGQPVAQVIEKEIAPIFLEDEVAARRVEKIVREELKW